MRNNVVSGARADEVNYHYKPTEQQIRENRIWSLLEAGGFPWLMTVDDLKRNSVHLAKSFGQLVIDYYQVSHRIGEFSDMYEDLQFSSRNLIGELPSRQFSGIFRKQCSDPREEIEYWRKKLSLVLGEAKDTSVSNTLSYQWRDGTASIKVTVFPIALQWSGQAAQESDPEAAEACSVHIDTGLDCIANEAGLNSYAAADFYQIREKKDFGFRVARGHFDRDMSLWWRQATHENRIDFSQLNALHIGITPEGSYIFQTDCRGYYLLDSRYISHIYVERLLPAKGGGEGTIMLILCHPDLLLNKLELGSSSNPDAYNDIAFDLAEIIDCEVELGEYFANC